jgi:hypothetical protein
MPDGEFKNGREGTHRLDVDPPVALQRIVVRPDMGLGELGEKLVSVAEIRGYRMERVFHPDDTWGENGSRFVLRVEVDPNDSMKDLILKPESEETFTFGSPTPGVVTLETSYRAPLLMNEEIHSHFRLVDELQPIVGELGNALQREVVL